MTEIWLSKRTKEGKELKLKKNWENNMNIFLIYKINKNMWLIANKKKLVLFSIFATSMWTFILEFYLFLNVFTTSYIVAALAALS